jgi:hypothetical protein
MTQDAAFLHHLEGASALGICESLLIALIDLKLISDIAAHDLLSDVISTHDTAAELSDTPEKHRAVAEIVRRILIGIQRCGNKEDSGGVNACERDAPNKTPVEGPMARPCMIRPESC